MSSTRKLPEPPRYEFTAYAVLAAALGKDAAIKAHDALLAHMSRHYSGGDAPGIVLVNGHLRFTELRRPGT